MCVYVCMYACMYVMYVCMYVCMHACMHAGKHVIMYTCAYVPVRMPCIQDQHAAEHEYTYIHNTYIHAGSMVSFTSRDVGLHVPCNHSSCRLGRGGGSGADSFGGPRQELGIRLRVCLGKPHVQLTIFMVVTCSMQGSHIPSFQFLFGLHQHCLPRT